MKFLEILKSIFGKIKSGINLETGWIPFINDQLKWSALLFIRTMAIILTIVFVLYITKIFNLRPTVMTELFGIKQESVDVVSHPDVNYTKDIKTIDDIIKMLEQKKKEAALKKMIKVKTDEKDKKPN